jgi:hypothetical protein
MDHISLLAPPLEKLSNTTRTSGSNRAAFLLLVTSVSFPAFPYYLTVKYQQKTFTLPVSNQRLTQDLYDLRVGKITQQEYDRRMNKRKEQNKC